MEQSVYLFSTINKQFKYIVDSAQQGTFVYTFQKFIFLPKYCAFNAYILRK